jgi:hypothetical protein
VCATMLFSESIVNVSHGIPFYGWSGQGFVTQENPHPAPADIPDANYLTIASHYFDVLRIPLIKGRTFTDSDTQMRYMLPL